MVTSPTGRRRPPFPVLPAEKAPASPQAKGQEGFAFATPAAREAWYRAAYNQAVSAENWALGDPMDDQTRSAIDLGIAGATAPYYKGPDDRYYFHNAHTMEDASTRAHRTQHVAGKTMDQIAAAVERGQAMPGADEYVAMRIGRGADVAPETAPPALPANDNITAGGAAKSAAPANDNRPRTPRPVGIRAPVEPSGVTQPTAAPPVINGRVAGMAKAAAGPQITAADFLQATDDYTRLTAAGLTGGYADNVAASLNAFFGMLGGDNLAAAYAANLAEERQRTEAARERRGTKGALVEIAPGFLPGAGDVSGLLADFRDYLENGDQWTAADWALVAAGLVPGAPNRKTVKAAENLAKDLTQNQGLTSSENAREKSKKKLRTVVDMLPKPDDFYTEGQARLLDSEPVGSIYVREIPSKNQRANEHEEGAEGQLYDIDSRFPFKPALRLKNSDPKGRDFIKFDGREIYRDHILMIERKTTYPWGRTKGMRQIKVNYRKSREALAQNNKVDEGEPVFKIMYELGSEEEVARVLNHMIQEGVDDILSVRVGKKWDREDD